MQSSFLNERPNRTVAEYHLVRLKYLVCQFIVALSRRFLTYIPSANVTKFNTVSAKIYCLYNGSLPIYIYLPEGVC